MSVRPVLARAWLDLVSTFLTAILLVMRRFYHLADWSWWAGALCPPPVMVWSDPVNTYLPPAAAAAAAAAAGDFPLVANHLWFSE